MFVIIMIITETNIEMFGLTKPWAKYCELVKIWKSAVVSILFYVVIATDIIIVIDKIGKGGCFYLLIG